MKAGTQTDWTLGRRRLCCVKAPLKRACSAGDKCLKIQNESAESGNNVTLNSGAASRLGASSVNVTGKKAMVSLY